MQRIRINRHSIEQVIRTGSKTGDFAANPHAVVRLSYFKKKPVTQLTTFLLSNMSPHSSHINTLKRQSGAQIMIYKFALTAHANTDLIRTLRQSRSRCAKCTLKAPVRQSFDSRTRVEEWQWSLTGGSDVLDQWHRTVVLSHIPLHLCAIKSRFYTKQTFASVARLHLHFSFTRPPPPSCRVWIIAYISFPKDNSQ